MFTVSTLFPKLVWLAIWLDLIRAGVDCICCSGEAVDVVELVGRTRTRGR